MADTTVGTTSANGQVIRFRTDFFREYVRRSRFSGYTGRGVNNPVVIKQDTGPTIRHPLVTRLTGSGVSGSDQLRGNGEAIGNYYYDTNPTYYRHAVEFNKEDKEKTDIDLMRAARPLLMEWALSSTRDRIIRSLGAVFNGTTYAELDSTDFTQGIADTWLSNNSDRQIFGANAGSGTDFSADLGQIDGTNDELEPARIDDMRRLAEDADPHIRPIETDQESEVYICFAGSQTFRDLKEGLQTINQNADVRGMKITRDGNILARDGDLFYNGVIIRKVPEITSVFTAAGNLLATAGAGSIKVEPAFFCGAQALVYGLTQAPDIIVDRDYDYGFRPGVAVELKEDIKKPFFNDTVQHGVVSGFFAGA